MSFLEVSGDRRTLLGILVRNRDNILKDVFIGGET
jgi:hypothetical protein